MIPKKAELAIHLLTMELRNARSRQKLRLKQQRPLAARIDTDIYWYAHCLEQLKMKIKDLQKSEDLENKVKKQSRKVNRDVGTNQKMTGTYGKG